MEHRNEVVLLGALSGEPDWRELPGGGHVVIWRTVVRRRSARSERMTHDTLRCATYDPAVQRLARAWTTGDLLEIRGALRRRFWRAGLSVYEVEVHEVNEVHAVARRGTSSGNDPPV